MSVPYTGQAAELDLDRSLERLLATPHPADRDLNVLDRRHHRRAYALILDVSGSMEGPALFHAALALADLRRSRGAGPVRYRRLLARDERPEASTRATCLWIRY